MKRNVSVVKLCLYVSECVCSKIIKELPGLVGSGTPCIMIIGTVGREECAVLSPRVKRPGREAGHSSPSSVKNTSNPPLPHAFMTCKGTTLSLPLPLPASTLLTNSKDANGCRVVYFRNTKTANLVAKCGREAG